MATLRAALREPDVDLDCTALGEAHGELDGDLDGAVLGAVLNLNVMVKHWK